MKQLIRNKFFECSAIEAYKCEFMCKYPFRHNEI